MSLLLDALKKAALEKQRREQPSGASAHASIAVPTASPNIPADNDQTPLPTLSETYHTEVLVPEHIEVLTPEPLAEPPEAPLVFDIDEIELEPRLEPVTSTEPLSLTEPFNRPESDTSQALANLAIEPLEVAFDEPIVEEFASRAPITAGASTELLAPTPIPVNETLPEEVIARPNYGVQSGGLAPQAEAAPLEKLAAVAPPAATVVNTATEESPPSSDSSVEAFNAAEGKAALAQLLTRSKKASDFARKRLILLYIFLSVTAILLVAFYYYLLQNNFGNLSHPATNSISNNRPVPPAAPVDTDTAVAATPTTEAVVKPDAAIEPQATAPLSNLETETPTKLKEPPQAITNYPAAQPIDDQPATPAPPIAYPINHAMILEHKPAEEQVSEAIARGYQAYQAGDFARAGTAYREALEQDPHQRDALLGAAAVAVHEGKQQLALGYYQQQLARNPKDEYAQSGILALSSSSSPEQNPELQSELSRLLLEYPEAAHLHFLQGSLYAQQQQWAAAQVSFFEAWQRDNKNPDLAFNLAVALDHLGQPKEAVRFYQQSLSLGDKRTVSFSTEAVARRLRVLSPENSDKESAKP